MPAGPAATNFFERQRLARTTTLRLVVLFVLGVASIVAAIDLLVLYLVRRGPTSTIVESLIAATVLTLLVLACGTGSKMLSLRGGGEAVALSAGATAVDPSTTDPQLKRFVNIVEEMSIASGVPMPKLFVLTSEPGINAFAAGYTPADAAVTVTGGALQTLNRDELQGVIGHEFSHVLNGDMRLNIRLIGLLSGILLLGLVGLRFLQFGGGRSRDSKGNPLLVIAIALVVLGFVGQFFAGLIQAAVSRQREWLADASAVQFTRQSSGLVGALKKIAGLPTGSTLKDSRSGAELRHMLFGDASRSLSSLYATHPPLPQRIAALDPSFTPAQVEQLIAQYASAPPDGLGEDAARGLVGGAAPPRAPRPPATARIEPADVSASVGTLSMQTLDRGRAIAAQIPEDVRRLASQPSTALALVLALLIDRNPEIARAQQASIAHALSSATVSMVDELVPQVAALPAGLRLPVAGLAAPQLASRPPSDRAAIIATLDALARADNRMLPFEYALIRVVGSYLADASDPRRRSQPGRANVTSMTDAAVTLLAVIAASGNGDPAAAAQAFQHAANHLLPGRATAFNPPTDPWVALDGVWPVLDSLDGRNKKVLVEALVIAVRDDGVVTVVEAELLRTACAMLHCPVPALLA